VLSYGSVSVPPTGVQGYTMIRCWQCGNDLEGYNKQDVDRAYDQGYMQAIRDTKNAKIDYANS
jgi:hypothetical protein